jgi:hypothetical protein
MWFIRSVSRTSKDQSYTCSHPTIPLASADCSLATGGKFKHSRVLHYFHWLLTTTLLVVGWISSLVPSYFKSESGVWGVQRFINYCYKSFNVSRGIRCLFHLQEEAEFLELHHSVTVVLLIGIFILLSSCHVSASYPKFYTECWRSLTWTGVPQAHSVVVLWSNKHC